MFLLDTHVVLWAFGARHRLSAAVRAVLDAPEASVFVSAVSVWEMCIKRAQGKLDVPDDLRAQMQAARFAQLVITHEHALVAGDLPLHHRDPFDRMLIAQAQVEGLTIVTHDAKLRPYGVPLVWT